MNDVANKPNVDEVVRVVSKCTILPFGHKAIHGKVNLVLLNVDEVMRVVGKCTIPPFGHKAIHGKVNLVLHGYKRNVMTHGLEKRLPSLPLGIDVQTVYATMADGSNRVTVVLRNNTQIGLRSRKVYQLPGW